MPVPEVFERNALYPSVVVFIVLTFTYLIQHIINADYVVPSGLPWVGRDTKQLFSGIRSSFSAINSTQKWLSEGYLKVYSSNHSMLPTLNYEVCQTAYTKSSQYSKRGLSYIIPGCLTNPMIIIPPASVTWLISQPEDVLSAIEFHMDILGGHGHIIKDRLLKEPFHSTVAYRYLPKRVGLCVEEIFKEVSDTIDTSWGYSRSSWKETNLWDDMTAVIARSSNRITVGLDLCRNQDYLDTVLYFTSTIFLLSNILYRTPRFLVPIVGPLIGLPIRYCEFRAAKVCIPVIEERKRNFVQKSNDANYEWEPPNDYLTWYITQAFAEGNMLELEPHTVMRRILLLNFAAIHSTTIIASEAILNLYSSDSSYVEGIHEEITRIYKEDNGVWTKASLARMVRTDSAIRETLRLTDIEPSGFTRKITSKDSIKIENEGYILPYGSYVSVDKHGIHHDPDLYANPKEYDAFRFSRLQEQYKKSDQVSTDILKMKSLGLVTTSDSFYAFGHGKHACPGRFLVAIELKLMLAHIILNYDIEPTAKHLPPSTLGNLSLLPHTKTKIKIKRKAKVDIALQDGIQQTNLQLH